MLAHYREMAEATDVPLNADFENGFADDPDGVAENVTRCIATGVAGLSVEDSPKSDQPLYDFDLSVARVKAARAAIDRAGGDVVFTARAENFIRGVNDLDDAIRRLKAYKDAGADCLYAPGIKTREQIEAVVKAVAPKPVNFLNSGAFGFTVNDLAAMGVRRISVGGSLARVAMHAFIRTATEIAKDGKFDGFRRTGHQSRTEQILRAKTASDTRETRLRNRIRKPASRSACRSRRRCRAASRPGNAQRPLWPPRKTRRAARGRPVEGVCRPGSASGPTFPPTGRSQTSRNSRAFSPSARRQPIPTLMPIIDPADRAVGYLTLLRIVPEMRVIEVGHVLYSPAFATHAARHRNSISAGALHVRDARLPAL